MSVKYILIMCLQAIWYGKQGKMQGIDDKLYTNSFKVLGLVRAKVSFFGKENLKIDPNKKYIIMCNHSSHYDIPLSFMAMGGARMRMIAKKELSKIPIFGTAMRASRTVIIDRKNLKQAIRDLKYATQLIGEGFLIWISPEGSRLRKKNSPLKKGGFIIAIEGGAQIIPIFINGADKILPAGTWDFYQDQDVDVTILPSIDASKYTRDNMSELMNELQRRWETVRK